ncbi:MAG: LysM peptidoglycan-binding domain-containing protein, partial [Pseudomonadota bacterium]
IGTMKFTLAFVTIFALSGLCLTGSPVYAQSYGPSYAQDDTSAPPDAAADSTSTSQDSDQDATPAPVRHKGEFSYSVRSGDSLGSIASTFGIQAADIAHANRLELDSTLLVGQTLRIPNPFAARMRALTAENQNLSDQVADLRKRADNATASQIDMKAQVQQLTASNRELTHDVQMLPWWRGAVYSAVIVSLLLLGAAALAVLEWFLLRRRFIAIAELNESLRRLDQRYRALLAKAELRMQELYGRRRRGISEEHERPRIPEEADLERLDQQLHDVLERHLKQLGGPVRPRRRSRWDEEFGTVASPVEARSARR